MKLSFSKVFVLCILSTQIYSKECNDIKISILSEKTINEDSLTFVKKGIEKNDLCFQNLMGIMIYEGIHFDKDIERAKSIFYQLSNKDYPEAQFNFALISSKDPNLDPYKVSALLMGVFIKYLSHFKYSHLSAKAKRVLLEYPNTIQNQKRQKSFSQVEINQLREKIYNTFDSFNADFLKEQTSLKAAQKEKWDNIMMIVSLGLIAYNLSATTSYNNYSVTNTGCGEWFACGYEWNPLHLNQFPN